MRLVSISILSFVFGNDFDQADNVLVHLGKVFSGNPKFEMNRGSDLLLRITGKKFSADGEPGDVAGAAVRNIPVASDLPRVFLIQDRVEDRLVGQARRKLTKTVGGNQAEFFRPDGSV